MSAEVKKALAGLTDAIDKNPKAANTVFRSVSCSTQNDLVVHAKIRDFAITMDEPPELGGTDTGPNPVELLLAALGGCQEIVYRAYAAVMGLQIDRIEVKAKGYLDLRGLLNLADVPSGFSEIIFETTIVSDEPEVKIQQLTAMVEQHCPVLDTLTSKVDVSGKVHVQRSTQAA
jgi:uncharacterized OsmC-like protein